MIKNYRQGAVGALLDEYERALADLQHTIADITDDELLTIVDNKTDDPRCRSVQSVLSHVVSAGYNYAIYIRKVLGHGTDDFRNDVLHLTIQDYHKDLDSFFAFTVVTLENTADDQLEEFDESKKIHTRWKQAYDIEQLAEHAIVHILRHRRQIEKFKIILREHK